jgi:hypothetical protein
MMTEGNQQHPACSATQSSKKDSPLQPHVSFANEKIEEQQQTTELDDTANEVDINKERNVRIARRMSRQNFNRFSKQISRKPSTVLHVLDGRRKRSSGSNTKILKARERINHLQRINNDRAINVMLITVSVAFLVLTFPFQFCWIADQFYKLWLANEEQASLLQDRYRANNSTLRNATTNDYDISQKGGINVYQVMSYAVQDVALMIRNLNFSINFFLYSTMSNLFRKQLNVVFQSMGFTNFILFKNSITTTAPDTNANLATMAMCSSPCRSLVGPNRQPVRSRLNSTKSVLSEAKPTTTTTYGCTDL